MDLVYHLKDSEQFFLELEETVKQGDRSTFLSEIDFALRTYINIGAQYYGGLSRKLSRINADICVRGQKPTCQQNKSCITTRAYCCNLGSSMRIQNDAQTPYWIS